MREPNNIRTVSALQPDFMGFIFYEKSPRFVGEPDKTTLAELPDSIHKVAVFVDESIEAMRETARRYGFDTLQLHGGETPLQCLQLQGEDFTVIKAFPIVEAADFEALTDYEGCADYFLFDTKTPAHGGSGQKFDWDLLQHYQGKTPFFLSGGIDLNDVEDILQINHKQLAGIDINSRFETEPALKDVDKIRDFIRKIHK